MDALAQSPREKAAIQLIAEDKTNEQIADILSINTTTVENPSRSPCANSTSTGDGRMSGF